MTQETDNNSGLSRELQAAIKAIASSTPPNWVMPLKAYSNGWPQAIGATVVNTDQHGVASVRWCGFIYTRRCSQNKKYGADLWFSRSIGNQEYARLITFKGDYSNPVAEPLSDFVVRALSAK